jgi:hypothetical protein
LALIIYKKLYVPAMEILLALCVVILVGLFVASSAVLASQQVSSGPLTLKKIVTGQLCENSRKWPSTAADRIAFEKIKIAQLDAAVRCVQYVLVSLARAVKTPQFFAGSELPDTRQKELTSFLSLHETVLSDDASAGTALFPRDAVSIFDRWCGNDAKVVAQNWEKGYSYKVCAVAKPTQANDEKHVLNSVESIVAVLLHEVAHTVHGDHEAHANHSPAFERLNTFLMQYAQCVLRQASDQEQYRWRGFGPTHTAWRDAITQQPTPFDISAFLRMCSQGTIHFCGVKIPVGKCKGGCGSER